MGNQQQMTPERFKQIEELYHAARERTAEDRAALLAQIDPELRREVESLLADTALAANYWSGLTSKPRCNCSRIRLSPGWLGARV
jgi:hypothetical protein